MRTTGHQLESEAAIYAEGTTYTREELARDYRAYADATEEPDDFQRWAVDAIRTTKYTVKAIRGCGHMARIIDREEFATLDEAKTYAEQIVARGEASEIIIDKDTYDGEGEPVYAADDSPVWSWSDQ